MAHLGYISNLFSIEAWLSFRHQNHCPRSPCNPGYRCQVGFTSKGYRCIGNDTVNQPFQLRLMFLLDFFKL